MIIFSAVNSICFLFRYKFAVFIINEDTIRAIKFAVKFTFRIYCNE
jgi:hypothetical protein